jgi:hypothetical protein
MTPIEYRAWCRDMYAPERVEVAKVSDIVPFVFWPNGAFQWVCPDCGRATMGRLGDDPVSGWENPRWTREGDNKHLTLQPSLGCPGFRTGDCPGHFWLRDGELVAA